MLCGHRFYDPASGRFLTRDPAGYAGGLDLYAYCGGNPVTQSDPSGFNPQNDGGDAWDKAASFFGGFGRGVGLGWLYDAEGINGTVDRYQGLETTGEVTGTVVSILATDGAGAEEEATNVGDKGEQLVTATGDGFDIAPAEKVRQIQKGEKIADLIDEVNTAQYGQFGDGPEQNIVSLKNGERWIVQGGADGTNWDNMADELNRIILHTHPDASGPSPDDMKALQALGQKSAWIKSIYRNCTEIY